VTTFCTLYQRRRFARLTTFVMLSTACALVAGAQTPPYALFQQSTLTGSGNTITALNVPVVISPGVTVYVNATIQFNVDSNGNLTVSTGFPQVIPAPALLASSFVAGKYVGPSTINSGNNAITVAGPGVTAGGATEWSLSAPAGASACTYPETATWYVGPMAANPLAARLQAAGITSTAYSYGVGSATCADSDAWYSGSLIGVSQIGNTLTIVSFSYAGVDTTKGLTYDQITYTLSPGQ